MKPLFRQEAVDHRRSAGFGDVIQRRHRGVAAAMVSCIVCSGALVLWSVQWHVAPHLSLARWLLQGSAGNR